MTVGAGDWVMATSQVRRMQLRNPLPVVVMGRNGRPQWSPVFENNPRIVRVPSTRTQTLLNGPGHRPYIAGKTEKNWTWKRWDIHAGEIFLNTQEQDFGALYGGRILIEPNTKVRDGNKAWLFDRWQAVVYGREGEFIQVGEDASRRLAGVDFVPTSLRQAFAILSRSAAFVGTEGALHHAAAAFCLPSVVLWSHFIAPEFTGYETQTNLRHAEGWCGSRVPCVGCRASMEAITVSEVATALENLKR